MMEADNSIGNADTDHLEPWLDFSQDTSDSMILERVGAVDDFDWSEHPAGARPSRPGTHVPLRTRLRAKSIPQPTWDRLRPTVEDLYIEKELSLDELMREMRKNHHFDAP